jgi:dUTP pyrophosphatase
LSGVTPEVPVVGDITPAYAHPGDAGADLTAAESVVIAKGGGRARVRTGLRVAIPDGYAGFVLPRSGLAFKHGITCLNTPGLVDSGYRGELMVLLLNTDPDSDFKVEVGDRIAQLVIQRVEHATFTHVDALDEHVRGDGGFGSTGRA